MISESVKETESRLLFGGSFAETVSRCTRIPLERLRDHRYTRDQRNQRNTVQRSYMNGESKIKKSYVYTATCIVHRGTTATTCAVHHVTTATKRLSTCAVHPVATGISRSKQKKAVRLSLKGESHGYGFATVGADRRVGVI